MEYAELKGEPTKQHDQLNGYRTRGYYHARCLIDDNKKGEKELLTSVFTHLDRKATYLTTHYQKDRAASGSEPALASSIGGYLAGTSSAAGGSVNREQIGALIGRAAR